MSASSLAAWLREGRRFTEREALQIAFDACSELANRARCGGGAGHLPVGLETVHWDPAKRRASLPGAEAGPVCAGFHEDARALGLALVQLLGGDAKAPEKLAVSPAFRFVLDGMLRAPPRWTPAGLKSDLAGAMAGVLPGRVFWKSRRAHASLVVLVSTIVLSWSLYRSWTGPNRVLRFEGPVRSLAFSPDGSRLAVAAGASVWCVDTRTWERDRADLPTDGSSRHHGDRAFAFSPDSKRLVVGQQGGGDGRLGGALFEWDLEAKTLKLLREVLGAPASAAYSPDGTKLAFCSRVPSPDGRLDPGELLILDPKLGHTTLVLNQSTDACSWVGWGPGGRVLYRAHKRRIGYDGGSYLAEASEFGSSPRTLYAEGPHALDRAALSPDGALFAVAEPGREVYRLLDRNGREARKLNAEAYDLDYSYRAFTPGAFSSDGRLYAAPFTKGVAMASRRVRVWDAKTWELLKEKVVRGGGLRNPMIQELAMSRRWLVAAFGNDFETELHLWDIAK